MTFLAVLFVTMSACLALYASRAGASFVRAVVEGAFPSSIFQVIACAMLSTADGPWPVIKESAPVVALAIAAALAMTFLQNRQEPMPRW
jgi:hypothetical protein